MRLFVTGLLLICSPLLQASNTRDVSPSKELHCLAQNIYFEARGESAEGQLAVALVSMNRVDSPRFPNSVCAVVWQPRQFSWTHDGKSDRPKEKMAWRQAMDLARFVYNNYHNLPRQRRMIFDITHGALHYYAPRLAKPYWVKHQEVTRAIGGHVFLRKRS